MAVLRDVAVFGMGNEQEVLTDADQADGLRRRGALIRRGHFLEIVMIHPKHNSARNENRNQGSHDPIVLPARLVSKCVVLGRAEGGTCRASGSGDQSLM